MDSSVLEAARKTSKTCQIEGCHEITVGSRTALCRKHRNNRYKQNYKKKKRRAQGSDEMQSESIESQLAEEKCLMEQKYASMLQQVLAEKQLELLQSEKVIQALRAHQKKVKENKIKEIQERKVKKEQEPPKEDTDKDSTVSLAGEGKGSHVTEKANSKATKTSKSSGKTNQSKKGPGKGSTSKDARVGNSLAFSGNMANISTASSSDLATKSLYTAGISMSPYLGNSSVSHIGQNLYATKGSHQMAPMQPLTMTIQQVPKIEKVFSYQPNVFSGVSNAGVYTKVCIDSVKDLSLGPHGKVAASIATTSNQPRIAPSASKQQLSSELVNSFVLLNPKAVQGVHTRLPQNALPYQAIQKAILPSANITSQAEHRRTSFQSLMTSCTSVPVTTGGNLATGVGMTHQSQMSFPLTNFSQAMSMPNNCQIASTGIFTQVPQTSQVVMSQNWSNQMVPGRLQAPTIHDDFLLQMLQENKEPQIRLGAQSQTNSALNSLDHVITDPAWAMTIGL